MIQIQSIRAKKVFKKSVYEDNSKKAIYSIFKINPSYFAIELF